MCYLGVLLQSNRLTRKIYMGGKEAYCFDFQSFVVEMLQGARLGETKFTNCLRDEW